MECNQHKTERITVRTVEFSEWHDIRVQKRGTDAGLVVVNLKVHLPAGEVLPAISDVGWVCNWHMNSELVSYWFHCYFGSHVFC